MQVICDDFHYQPKIPHGNREKTHRQAVSPEILRFDGRMARFGFGHKRVSGKVKDARQLG